MKEDQISVISKVMKGCIAGNQFLYLAVLKDAIKQQTRPRGGAGREKKTRETNRLDLLLIQTCFKAVTWIQSNLLPEMCVLFCV